DEGPKSDCKP
uniref:Cryptide TyPep-5 n=2 Tax=Tityus TaxID=6886 RepID=CRY5_TITSE|nr:RecName: Full=Toxin To27; AltName: Full=Toxin Tc27 [Tityus obscurus]